MSDRFRFRFGRYNEVLKKWTYVYADFMTIDGTAKPYDDSEGGSQCIYDDCVVEQCTGLKDKNGKLIYEGDVLQLIDQQIDYIVGVSWNKGMFCYEITPNSANLVFSDLSDNEKEVTIIGNIHENGDLIE